MAKTVINPRILCIGCKKEFKIKKSMIERKKITDKVDCTFIKCTHCNKKLIITYEDKEFKELCAFAKKSDGIANLKLLIEVKGLAQLSKLLARLEQQPGIISARRLVQGS